MGLNDISANTNVWAITLKDNQNQALAIGGSTDDYLVFDTDTCKLFLSQNGNNLNNFKMSSGTIDNVIIGGNTATSATFTDLF
ncbi:MAG: hypothetical protein Rpha_0940 [Candidatus Ruthia sp. Apha_13_S6]|nr:hypothetical protein [Candidatus Ruthia sp. Apha_13_S6]